MDKSTVFTIIERFRQILESNGITASKLVLFGSYANGTNREGSDIDLIVISKDFENKDFWERIGLLSEAIYELSEPIEAVALTPDEWKAKNTLIAEYAENGIAIN